MAKQEHIETPAAPAANGEEERAALARMTMRLFEHWALSLADQATLLGLSPGTRSTLARYRRGAAPLPNTPDLLDRVGHLLGIHKSLRLLFPHNRDLVYRWVNAPNRRFDGKTPLEVMREHGFLGIVAVRRYLDFERGR